ncbi:putative GPI anchored protein [Geopyxis carbonaria]|nr:putative GPI anchored protein [Geopyxis carbonaria]
MKLPHLLSLFLPIAATWGAFVHPGMLHTSADFSRIASKLSAGEQPWTRGWARLTANSHASASYTPTPLATVYRGTGSPENYATLFNDLAAGYATAVRWRVTGIEQYGVAAARIVNAWTSTLTTIDGTGDKYLAAGLYGFQLANIVEILRDYPGFTAANLAQAKSVLLNVFLPLVDEFLTGHNGAVIDAYYAGWDLSMLVAQLSIGILVDDSAIYNRAMTYFYSGAGMGSLPHCIWKLYPNVDNGLAQLQESGRDQGHTMLSVGLMGIFAKMALSQGVDLFAYDDHRLLKGAEYAAKYNLGYDVPYTTYANSQVTQTVISDVSRGDIRPIWELLGNQYSKRLGLNATWTLKYVDFVNAEGGGAEGGGGNYGPNSGGYDQLGYGTVMYSL